MIKIKEAEEEFKKYTNAFDLEEKAIRGKFYHTFRVEDNCSVIANSIFKQDIEENVNLARIIGLFHDLGRFEQYHFFHTFADKMSFDHAERSEEIIIENGYNDKFVIDDDIIKNKGEIINFAVRNHSKYRIEETNDENKIIFSNIVRDADKLDIVKECSEGLFDGEEHDNNIKNGKFKEIFLNQILNKQELDKKGEEIEPIDHLLIYVGFIFDMNYRKSLEILKENDYINKIFDRYTYLDETKEKVDMIKVFANECIDERIKLLNN